MVRKTRQDTAAKPGAQTPTGADKATLFTAELPSAVSESAQQIWQAGLGAFTRAQLEGSKTFEALVREGVEIQRKTQAAAEEKISEATSRMTDFASQFSSGTTGQWGKLSTIFEDRVARALQSLGVPSTAEVEALKRRIEVLEAALKRHSDDAQK